MPLDYERLRAWREAPVRHRYGRRDTILYALGVGLGADPVDAGQLRFVQEQDLRALPTLATVLAARFGWLYEAGAKVTAGQCVHGEQGLVVHTPLPPEGEVVGDLVVTDIVDKGADKGAIVYFERTLRDVESGRALCTLHANIFCRADGGFGGPRQSPGRRPALPDRVPDTVCDLPTVPQQALLYRLNGDPNPIHWDPAAASAAGFRQPILHGLCTFGVVGHALLRARCGYDPARLRAMSVRFSAPVYPGETIRTEMWHEGDAALFRARVVERDVVVLDGGRAVIG